MSIADFFTAEEKKHITDAIKAAELDTSGEIRVHVEGRCKGEALDCAAYWFGQLKMHKTAARNGVLFYLAVSDRKFAILGDAGINAKVADDFWENIKEHMLFLFKEGRFADGLSEGIIMAGEQLKKHFPYQSDDVNELSDEISFGKK
ncbi:TPM domain-containing protein [Mangrovibacterium lignilyticum]|uniref:TPM domain-containing protein n=1 Tax=Mangrovibacterium lignilyticum TaxID=2668052 RepID=UPI0013D1FA9A|nr:TPM domain-containing protein [Mangrovibacterium lignilyticum]